MRIKTKHQLVVVLDQVSLILEKCGGLGSGVPGPCPIGNRLSGTGNLNAAQRQYPHIVHLLNGARIVHDKLPLKQALKIAGKIRAEQRILAGVMKDPKGKRGQNHFVFVPESRES